MSLVTKVGRKTWKARLAMTVIYSLLCLGAATTLYPFLVMMTTGFKGPTDQNDNRLIPLYWSDQDELLKKYRDDKYSGNMPLMASMEVGKDAPEAEIDKYDNFLMSLPEDQWLAAFRMPSGQVTSRLSLAWQDFLKKKYRSVDDINTAYTEINPAFQRIQPPPELLDRWNWNPKQGPKWNDWLEFKKSLPANWRIPIRGQRLWQEFLRTKYQNQFDQVPADLKNGADSFEKLTPVKESAIYKEFITKGIPKAFKNGFIEDQWAAVSSSQLPTYGSDILYAKRNRNALVAEFSSRNYGYMLDYILLNGRALWNTVLFCGLAILTQLIVNPLCAYALSRFPMRATAKILLFLLATMAFPAEVAMIPSFLLLKDLHLLNTFAALVLPGAASGFMIFLLKGFFDSLPREVFESGQLDGASEPLMMWKLAFPLSKPVLGYLALLAFMGAYGSFMHAFLVAQNRDMWTIMVFIFTLQGFAPKPVIMAALTLAAIPTLFVFLAAQRVIMRGIVLPGER